jgi:hypothetical protein
MLTKIELALQFIVRFQNVEFNDSLVRIYFLCAYRLTGGHFCGHFT